MTRTQRDGFTLIELLVVTSVGVLLLTGVVVAYNSFFRRQSSFASAQEVISTLQMAQTRARSGDRPSDCLEFTGYQVRGQAGQSHYFLEALCDGDPVESVQYALLPNEIFVEPFTFLFPPLPGSVAANDTVIGITQLGNPGTPPIPRYEFTVTTQGQIQGGSYVREN